MKDKVVFHLFIPSLLKQLNSWHKDFSFEIEAPYLSALLTQFDSIETNKSYGLDTAFFQTIDPSIEELPIAYYRHQVQLNKTERGLICADPIHLEVSMNDVTLTQEITDLTDSEAKELIDMLNKHFSQDGLEFIFGSNQCWYISFGNDLSENEEIKSYDLDSVLMKNIIGKLATSTDRNWQIIQNETQMLLHTSEVNQQREIAGLSAVNSLWFWGAGRSLISKPKLKVNTIYTCSDQPSKLRGQTFAKATDSQWQALPTDITHLLSETDKQASTQILLLEKLYQPALLDDLDGFQRELTGIDQGVVQPLFKAWKNNEIEIVIDCCDGNIFKPKKVPSWKFWNKPQVIREIADEVSS